MGSAFNEVLDVLELVKSLESKPLYSTLLSKRDPIK